VVDVDAEKDHGARLTIKGAALLLGKTK
ncbi:MAG: hypothetical protein JWQ62_2085, partial [Lacunisphaera sp.]|nr:hypothetical protein [Lacunisphaera sp.]